MENGDRLLPGEPENWELITYDFITKSTDLQALFILQRNIDLAKRLSNITDEIMREMGFMPERQVKEKI